MHVSTLLDPRFKAFPMNEGDEHLPTIKQELVKMIEAEGSVTYDVKSNTNSDVDTNVSKKPRVSGLCSCFSTKLDSIIKKKKKLKSN